MLKVFWASENPSGKYLSNMQPLPTPLTYKGRLYPSVEHGFQAAKYRYVLEDKPKKVLKMFQASGPYGDLPPIKVKAKGGRKAMLTHRVTLNTTDWDEKKDSVMAHLLKERAEVDSRFKAMLIDLARRNVRILHHDRGGARSYWGGSFPASVKEKDRTPSDFRGVNKFGILLEELGNRLLKKSMRKEKKKLKPRSHSTSPSRPKAKETKKREKSPIRSALKKDGRKKKRRRVSFSDDKPETKEPESPRTLRIRKVVEKHLKDFGGPEVFDQVVSGVKILCDKDPGCMKKCLFALIGANPEEKAGIVRLSSTVMDLGAYSVALQGLFGVIDERKKAEMKKKGEELARIIIQTSHLEGPLRPALGDNTKWSGKGNAISRQ